MYATYPQIIQKINMYMWRERIKKLMWQYVKKTVNLGKSYTGDKGGQVGTKDMESIVRTT